MSGVGRAKPAERGLRGPIDWDVAARVGARTAPRPPKATRAEVSALEAGLADAAERARSIAAETAQLPLAPDSTTIVLDRPGWVRASCESFGGLFGQPGGGRGRAVAAGAETGALLGLLAGRVLGQFDPWAQRLVLVAPNVLMAQRKMEVPADPFHLWVCLHEETHRLQFNAAPWLTEHITVAARELLEHVEPDWAVMMRTIGSMIRGEKASTADVIGSNPRAAASMDRVTAVMSLLEGHADVMMDRVGPGVVPGLGRIRRRFEARRRGTLRDRVIGRLLGLDVKLAQYRDGARFCRDVIAEVGVEGLNRVWAGPDALPTRTEIAAPDQWIERNT
ncbi:zinc-dependent metalloprotease [Propioniferax innocua]|uniref:Putative hydrolase/coenzyme F420 biosynthesis associated uncharacterized protein n=1 Tax=Propioniferax innocua TaxID=1753 RepID=A0A542ZCT8_9ACTN|nr:zinc-dependent metalloprotease [Propioniferax innocua]TQL58156.1 putative hydrolase/coenzyme F420 biosynthesis associated uncharacterized protein [Propioniferax innocua]